MSADLPQSLRAIEGATESPSMFSQRSALWVNGKEIAHRDSDTRFDVRLTRAVIRQMRAQLRAEPRVHLRKSSGSDWVEVEVTCESDEALLATLVERAAAAHRPPAGEPAKPPPTGADLERRRRFH